MQTNSEQPVPPAEANDSRTASDEAVVCKELLGIRRMGELWQILEKAFTSKQSDAWIWMQLWKDDCEDPASFTAWLDLPATELQVEYFVEDMLHYFREEMEMTSTDALYEIRLREGREAMNVIATAAETFGVGFGAVAHQPVTPSEAVIMAQSARTPNAPANRPEATK